MIKRIIGLILALSMISCALLSLSSCDRSYDEDEVLSAAKTLIERSQNLKINEIFFGEGIKHNEYQELIYGNYKEADFIHLNELGFDNFAELEYITTMVYTKECYNSVFKNVLRPSYDANGNVKIFARYLEKVDEESGEVIALLVNVNYEGLVLEGSVEYHTSTLEIVDVEDEIIRVSVGATVTSGDGEKTQDRRITFNMIELEDGWRLDSPIYVGYDENYDRYDDLLKENEGIFGN